MTKTHDPEGYINKKNIVFVHLVRLEGKWSVEAWTLLPEPMRTFLLTPPREKNEAEKFLKKL